VSAARSSPLGGRLAALALLMLGAAIVIAGVASHVAGVREAHARRVAGLENERRVLARLLAEDARAAAPAGDDGRALVAAEEPTIAAAQVQGLLVHIVQAGGGAILTSQSMTAETADGLTRLPVQMAFEADIAQLVAIMSSIERAETLLVLDRFAVVDPDGSLSRLGGAAEGPNRLRVDMTVDAYWRAP